MGIDNLEPADYAGQNESGYDCAYRRPFAIDFVGGVANATETFVAGRERRRQVQKLHMLIGLFFSELGNGLLRRCSVVASESDGGWLA